MSVKSNKEKSKQLGMNHSTASARLKKMIILNLLESQSLNTCYKCDGVIKTYEDLTVEHREPWLHVSAGLFWDLSNIAFSHRKCNVPDRACNGRRKINNQGDVWCIDCGGYLSQELFAKYVRKKRGKKVYNPCCKECMKVRNKKQNSKPKSRENRKRYCEKKKKERKSNG